VYCEANQEKKGLRVDMKKIAILMLSICLFVAFSATPAMAAKPASTGFNQDGVNYKARMVSGWMEDILDLVYGEADYEAPPQWLTAKWSKDWVWGDPQWLPPDDTKTAVGAWFTVHITFYLAESRDFANWVERDSIPADAAYKVEKLQKMMKVGDNFDAWEEYRDGGAMNADKMWGCGNYASGCPKYVMFQDTTKVYERGAGDVWVLIETTENASTSPKGLGHPIF
jgi:hypothetical protein